MKTSASLRSLRHTATAGFTLLEIMLVVMIIALLAGSAIYLMRGNVETTKIVRAGADIETVKTQLQMYETLNGALPSTDQGLMALVQRPSGDPQPRKWSQLIPEVPLDPWNTPYQYRYPATKSTKDSYDLFSAGRDRQANTADDIGNW